MKNIYDQHSNYWLNKSTISNRFMLLISQKITKDTRILDLGCGGGRLTFGLNLFARVCGVDRAAELIEGARLKDPTIDFVIGDITSEMTWEQCCPFNVVVSNAVIRKDHCPLERVAELARKYKAQLVLRIQSHDDLKEVSLKTNPFYSIEEIKRILPEANIEVENYCQRFSSKEYVDKFLSRIDLQGKVASIRVNREYFLITSP